MINIKKSSAFKQIRFKFMYPHNIDTKTVHKAKINALLECVTQN